MICKYIHFQLCYFCWQDRGISSTQVTVCKNEVKIVWITSFSLLRFSYVLAPYEIDLKSGLPCLENFHGWIQENGGQEKALWISVCIQCRDLDSL